MQPTILQKPEILLVGVSFYGDPFETNDPWSEANQIGRTCQRLDETLEKYAEKVLHRVDLDVTYEVHVYGDATQSQGLFEVFAGVPVAKIEAVPVELSVKMLPTATYAVFTLEGEAILSDWYMHIQEWLATAGYEHCHPYSVQYYDGHFKGIERISESTMYVYMPVRLAGA